MRCIGAEDDTDAIAVVEATRSVVTVGVAVWLVEATLPACRLHAV